jgi:hypothetical protein
MKNFVLNIIAFLLFSLTFYGATLFLWESYVPSRFKPNINYRIGVGQIFSRLSEVKNTNDIDVLFLGSSRAYRSFDPRTYSSLGLKTFNLGSSSQTPIQTNLLLKRYLEDLNPKLVVFEINPLVFTLDGVESSLQIIANYRNDLHSFEMALKLNNIKTYNTLMYGVTRDLLNLNESFTEPYKEGIDTYIPGGFVEKELLHFKPISFEKKEISISRSQLDTFSEIISSLKSKDIEVILVYAPIAPSKYSSYLNMWYFDSLMTSYSEYYNFNEINTLKDSLHFYDENHMNQLGVELFSKELSGILNAR